MSLSLELVRKVPALEKVRPEGIMTQPPLVGERWIVCRADFRLMAVLDRKSLEVVHRYDDPDMYPLAWLGPERLLMMGPQTVGVWDVAEERLVWRDDRRDGGFAWRDRVVTWASDSKLEFRLSTGEIERTLDLGMAARGYGTPCRDFYVSPTADDHFKSCDPTRAVRMTDGSVQWVRNLLVELNERYPAVKPKPPLVIGEASMLDRCIVTRERIMAACSLTDGAILWIADVAVPYHWPLVVDGRIPVLSGDTRFTVVDEATGAILVDRQHSEPSKMFHKKRGSVLGDLVIFGSESSHLAAFDLRTGDLVYSKKHKGVAFWATAVADGRLLAAGTDGNLWVFEAA